jgi:hypothetical protein
MDVYEVVLNWWPSLHNERRPLAVEAEYNDPVDFISMIDDSQFLSIKKDF